jgi:predicted type IV restriction endonuclease
MQAFIERVKRHAEHVMNVGVHCTTEETTKQALILPLLDILGFSPFDPTRVKAEYGSDFPGAKSGERVDYALFCHAVSVMFIEAKAHGEKLSHHSPQLSRYFNATPEVAIAAITNGRQWEFFTDLNHKNVMDAEPFLTIDFTNLDESLIDRLYRFRHDEFQPEALRTLAEESIYLAAFKDSISASLRQCDAEFVRYVAGRSNIQRQLNAKFIESITPLVKQAVEKAVSEMVVSGLSASQPPQPDVQSAPIAAAVDPHGDITDPNNARIVTTYAERRLLEVAQDILGPATDITPKDTESYFAILYQGKTNRWLLRYFSDKKQPGIQICIPMTDERRREVIRAGLEVQANDSISLASPDHLARIPGILTDCLNYCRDDNNFKKAAHAAT